MLHPEYLPHFLQTALKHFFVEVNLTFSCEASSPVLHIQMSCSFQDLCVREKKNARKRIREVLSNLIWIMFQYLPFSISKYITFIFIVGSHHIFRSWPETQLKIFVLKCLYPCQQEARVSFSDCREWVPVGTVGGN